MRIALGVSMMMVLAAADPIHIRATSCGGDSAPPPLAVSWRGDTVQTAEFSVRLGDGALRNHVIAVRFDPQQVRLALDVARDGDAMAPWSIDDAPADARVAMNAGQFTDAGPWGWVVHRGREWQAPGVGSLAGALIVDGTGAVAVIDAARVPETRAAGDAVEALQSYPTLLTAAPGGAVAPALLCAPNGGLDLTHRDTRLAVGVTAEGRVLVVLTRFELPGGVTSRIPIGPTTPEMAELMQRLGARHALMLDGGLSSQLSIRTDVTVQDRARGPQTSRWPGVRRVPLALVAR